MKAAYARIVEDQPELRRSSRFDVESMELAVTSGTLDALGKGLDVGMTLAEILAVRLDARDLGAGALCLLQANDAVRVFRFAGGASHVASFEDVSLIEVLEPGEETALAVSISEARARELLGREEIGPCLLLPLTHENEVFGALVVSAKDPVAWETSVWVVEAAAACIGQSLATARVLGARRSREVDESVLADRMARVGALAASVAHEVNNPLAAVLANLEIALDHLGRNHLDVRDLVHWLGDAREGASRIRQIMRDLRVFARAGDDEPRPLDLHAVLDAATRLAGAGIRHRVSVVKNYAPVPKVHAVESRLAQIVLGLIVSAAGGSGDEECERCNIRVGTRVGPAGCVEIDIASDARSAGREGALALEIGACTRLLADMGGELGVAREEGITRYRVTLAPVGAIATNSSTIPAPTSRRARGRLLVIDDEATIGSALRRIFGADHEVTVALTAAEALDLIASGNRFDLILCDLMMPVMTGMEFYAELSSRSPGDMEKVVFLTGGAFTPKAAAFLDQIENTRVEKPFDIRSLKALVNARIGAAARPG